MAGRRKQSGACARESPRCVLIYCPRPRAGLNRSDHLVQGTQGLFPPPGLDHRRELPVDSHHGLDLRALVGIERLPRAIFGG